MAKAKDKAFPDLRSRLEHVMEEMGWNQSELARQVSTGPGAVGNWLTRNGGMKPEYAFRLQDKHRWNARWILEGVGPRRMEAADHEAQQLLNRILDLPPERRNALAVFLGELP